MDIEAVLIPEWIEECQGVYGAYVEKDVGKVNLDSKLVADDVFALMAEREFLLDAIGLGTQRDPSGGCAWCDRATGHFNDCPGEVFDAILARARGVEWVRS